jgi:hypothetical protein
MDAIPSSIFLVLALALLAMAGGMGVWLFSYVKKEGLDSPKRERPPVTETPPKLEASAQSDVRELLSIYRMEKGDLAIFVQGERYHHLREIRDQRLGNETVEAIKHVMTFAEGWLPTIQQPTPQSTSSRQESTTVDEEAFLEQLRQKDLFPVEKPSTGLFSSRRRRKASRPLTPLRTPAEEINELVQKRLQERRGEIKQDIYLSTGVDGSLCIRVGLQTCTSPDDIADPQIRALVQDAVREWEEG